jgi:hypothetical protein
MLVFATGARNQILEVGHAFQSRCLLHRKRGSPTIWIVDAHRDGKRFVVQAHEKLTAFVETERAIHQFAVNLIS